MESPNRHPLESITKRSDLSMLELLIPFVDYPLKLPLALFIKLNEIMLIANAFRSADTIERMGLHSESRDPMQIIGSLTGISPEMLQLFYSYANTAMDSAFFPDSSAYKEQTDTANTDTTDENGFPSDSNLTSDSDISDFPPENTNFETNIQKILADYDMQQAQQFAEETEKLNPY